MEVTISGKSLEVLISQLADIAVNLSMKCLGNLKENEPYKIAKICEGRKYLLRAQGMMEDFLKEIGTVI